MQSKIEDRIRLIEDLIQNNKIGSQEKLLSLLKEEGHPMAQATLSRDLKKIGVSKVFHTEHGYIYHIPEEKMVMKGVGVNTMADAFISMTFSHNIAVIKTLPAYATGICSLIDNLNSDKIIGTIAGDDTIMIVISENVRDRNEIKDILIGVLPSLLEKL